MPARNLELDIWNQPAHPSTWCENYGNVAATPWLCGFSSPVHLRRYNHCVPSSCIMSDVVRCCWKHLNEDTLRGLRYGKYPNASILNLGPIPLNSMQIHRDFSRNYIFQIDRTHNANKSSPIEFQDFYDTLHNVNGFIEKKTWFKSAHCLPARLSVYHTDFPQKRLYRFTRNSVGRWELWALTHAMNYIDIRWT